MSYLWSIHCRQTVAEEKNKEQNEDNTANQLLRLIDNNVEKS